MPQYSPLVSVIIPVYNTARFLPEALDSVLRQTYSHLELIVVDDGSTDDVHGVIESYKGDMRRRGIPVTVLHQSHKNRAAAANYGIRAAAGELVAFLDADDALPQQSISMRAWHMDDNPHVDVLFSDLAYVRDNQRYSTHSPPSINPTKLRQMCLHAMKAPVHINTYMFRIRAFSKAGLFDESYDRAEDAEFALRVLDHCSIDYIPIEGYQYQTAHHPVRERIRRRLQTYPLHLRIVQTHTHGMERYWLSMKRVCIDTLKLGYEVFSGTK